MAVANAAKSLIVANIYDTDIGKISKGKEVVFTSDIFPQETFKGVITYLNDVVDADSKTIKTYIKPLSGTNLLKQNMFLKIRLLIGEYNMPIVLKSAVIYKDGKFYVQVKKDNKFEMKEIKPIRDVSDKLMAVDGLIDGDIVACAAIDLEQR
jgi:membrane fusion protein, heavy metal efflux system